MPQDARNKLRQMGGITAAFPEMVQAQQEMPTAPVERGAPAEGSAFRDLLRGTGEAFLRPITTTGRDALDMILGTTVGAANMPVAGAAGLAGMAGDLVGAEDFASSMYDQAGNMATAGRLLMEEGYFDAQRFRPSDTSLGMEGAREAADRRSRSESAAAEQALEMARKQKLAELYGPGSEGGPTRPRRLDDPEEAQRMADEAIRLLNIPTEDPDGGGGDGDGDTSSAPTLRERYDEQLALLKEVFGEDDNEAARDKAMTLAMVGLAALTGPRGQLLQNLAEGALIGLSATGKRREKRREREQEIRGLAMQTAIDQQAAVAEAEAEAARMDRELSDDIALEEAKARFAAEYGTGSGTYTPERLRQNAIDAIMQNPGEFNVLDANGLVDPAKVAAMADQIARVPIPSVAAQVQKDKAAGKSDEEIRNNLIGAGVDPSVYGV